MSKRIETICVTYDLATPLFCGGADPAVPEVRMPSFKGVLRWYWRAVVWAQMSGALKTIQQAEQTLFGSPGRGQGKVLMRWAPGKVTRRQLAKGDVLKDRLGRTVGLGVRYLGYGVMEAFGSQDRGTVAGQLIRGCIVPPLALVIELRCRDLTTEERDSLRLALCAVGLLGGMGGKSRKGYGSLVLRELTVDGAAQWHAPSTIEALHERIVELRRDCAVSGKGGGVVPEYTALTAQSRYVLVPAREGADAIALLDLVGRELVRYRSWGRNGMVLGNIPSERRFQTDHDMMKEAERRAPLGGHPRRVAFGLPHNYGKGPQKAVTPDGLDRRASPLLVHIHTCGSTPVAVLSFLPARFLPEETHIIAFGTKAPVAAAPGLWKPITDLLDRFLDSTTSGSMAGQRKERFGKAMEVGP